MHKGSLLLQFDEMSEIFGDPVGEGVVVEVDGKRQQIIL